MQIIISIHAVTLSSAPNIPSCTCIYLSNGFHWLELHIHSYCSASWKFTEISEEITIWQNFFIFFWTHFHISITWRAKNKQTNKQNLCKPQVIRIYLSDKILCGLFLIGNSRTHTVKEPPQTCFTNVWQNQSNRGDC